MNSVMELGSIIFPGQRAGGTQSWDSGKVSWSPIWSALGVGGSLALGLLKANVNDARDEVTRRKQRNKKATDLRELDSKMETQKSR